MHRSLVDAKCTEVIILTPRQHGYLFVVIFIFISLVKNCTWLVIWTNVGLLDWYCQTSDIIWTLVGNKIVDHSDVAGASPAGAAPTTSSFSTWHPASMDWAKTTARWDEIETFRFWDLMCFILEVWQYIGSLWWAADPGASSQGVGITKASFINFSMREIFDLIKVPVRSFE